MSGIYIKGMEMPESCITDDCPCVNRENGFCQADPETRYVYGDRPHWCPLVPVPDHGDLIYRGYAIATACSGLIRTEDGEDWIRVKEVRENIKTAPIIIPADPGGASPSPTEEADT